MVGRLEYPPNDGDWSEVIIINSYAVFIGYLSMAIKGLGFLVLTWTTVVLLGGFVSSLHKTDFWCLTFITLVQMTGVIDVVMNEKLSYIELSALGVVSSVMSGVMGDKELFTLALVARTILANGLLLVQLVFLVTVLCPLAIIYLFGILMSGGISLWRLIAHDYLDGEASNLTPAMDTLYCLALIQGVVFCYRFILGRSGKMLAKYVVGYDNHLQVEAVSDYLRETRIGCEKDPTFSNGRNLVTYAVDMIGSRSIVDRISGVNILYTSINIMEMKLNHLKDRKEIEATQPETD